MLFQMVTPFVCILCAEGLAARAAMVYHRVARARHGTAGTFQIKDGKVKFKPHAEGLRSDGTAKELIEKCRLSPSLTQ